MGLLKGHLEPDMSLAIVLDLSSVFPELQMVKVRLMRQSYRHTEHIPSSSSLFLGIVEAFKTSNLGSRAIMANLIRFLRQPAPSHLLLHGVILARPKLEQSMEL